MPEAIGGQAIIEGVMIASNDKVAMAVRKEDRITRNIEARSSLAKKLRKIFFIRGIVALIEMLVIGTKALMWSTEQSVEEESGPISWWEMTLTLVISFGFGILLFIAVPLWISKLLSDDRIIFNILDGVLRIIVFLAYLIIIAQFKDIKRVFEYHGAEHKAIACYEDNKRLSVKNIQQYSTKHPRCGTSFLLIVLVLSIIVFSLVWSEHWYLKFLYRIVLIPVIAGIGYEILKLGDKFKHNTFMKALIAPGIWLQHITTREPDDKQVEVAISAVQGATTQ